MNEKFVRQQCYFNGIFKNNYFIMKNTEPIEAVLALAKKKNCPEEKKLNREAGKQINS